MTAGCILIRLLLQSDAKEDGMTIGDYYDSVAERRRVAQAELDAARAAGASKEVIARLEERVLWAGYTGD